MTTYICLSICEQSHALLIILVPKSLHPIEIYDPSEGKKPYYSLMWPQNKHPSAKGAIIAFQEEPGYGSAKGKN